MLKAHRASLKVHSKAAVDLTRGNGQEPEGYGSASGLSGGPSQAEAVTFGGDAEDEKVRSPVQLISPCNHLNP